MNKKLQVFVSSTYTDLIEERQAAVEAILDAGHIPAGMELFKAGKSQMKTIQKWIDESDVYMLILGGRYGSIEEESGLSYTELEYTYALSKNMPVFAVILKDSFLFTKAASCSRDVIFEKDNVEKYNTFKNIVKSNIVKFVNNVDQIATALHSQLNHLLGDPDYNLTGWVKNSSISFDQEEKMRKVQKLQLNSSIKMAVVLDFSSQSPKLKDVIKQVCNSFEFKKPIRAKYIEEMPYPEIQKEFCTSNIIIYDISYIDDGDAFLLGYLAALNKNVVLLCENERQHNLGQLKYYYPKFDSAIFYNDQPNIEFFFQLQNSLYKYLL